MASNTCFVFFTVALLLLVNISGRTLHATVDSTNIATRLTGGGLMQCWDALYKLKSCTDEIVLFFLNREAKLSSGCCNAVDVITTDCWPAMLTSLGFTSEETNVLRGFCQSPSSDGSPSPAPSPVDVITTDCWPAMLTSLGFTSEETNVLRGFCQSPSSDGSPSPAPSPVKV